MELYLIRHGNMAGDPHQHMFEVLPWLEEWKPAHPFGARAETEYEKMMARAAQLRPEQINPFRFHEAAYAVVTFQRVVNVYYPVLNLNP